MGKIDADSGPSLSAPELLTAGHDLSAFDCGEQTLNDWLRKRALTNQSAGASRTYVICEANRVVGYYALAVGAVAHEHATGKIRRNIPDPVPVMILARLAMDTGYHGRGIGAGLLRDAIFRTVRASEIAGIPAILVHAISDSARHFYERCGFYSSPVDPMTLMITVEEARRAMQGNEA